MKQENEWLQNSPRKKSEAEILREQNIKERDAFFASFMHDPEFAEAVNAINSYGEEKKAERRNTSKKKRDEVFRFTGHIPLERRKSARLKNLTPEYTKDDLPEETISLRKREYVYNEDLENLEEVVYVPKRPRYSTKRTGRPPILPVEDVTEDMLNNICRTVSSKVYSEYGSSCHQCRQKTKDTKTCCRNENCVGIRGQFCGVCIINRYGEDGAVALKDPNWHCFVCRGICNCSFCRTKAGKRPTGILTPLALQHGHKSVKDFLESLKGEGDYSHQDKHWQKLKDPENLLGFSKDLKAAVMGGSVTVDLKVTSASEIIETVIEKLTFTIQNNCKF